MRSSLTVNVAALLLTAPAVASAAALSATLVFERDVLDLESGNLFDRIPDMVPIPPQFDFWFAYNGNEPVTHASLFHYSVYVSAAFLPSRPFDTVEYSDVLSATFQQVPLFGDPFRHDDTMLLLTGDGNYYKVGNAVETYPPGVVGNVTVDYEKLVPAPEPSTFLLAALAGMAMLAFRGSPAR